MPPILKPVSLIREFLSRLLQSPQEKKSLKLLRPLPLYLKQMRDSNLIQVNQLRNQIRNCTPNISRPERCQSINSSKSSFKNLQSMKRLFSRNSIQLQQISSVCGQTLRTDSLRRIPPSMHSPCQIFSRLSQSLASKKKFP